MGLVKGEWRKGVAGHSGWRWQEYKAERSIGSGCAMGDCNGRILSGFRTLGESSSAWLL